MGPGRASGAFSVLTRAEIRDISQTVICPTIKRARNANAFTEQGVAMLSSVLKTGGKMSTREHGPPSAAVRAEDMIVAVRGERV
jgi:hypothetical protein